MRTALLLAILALGPDGNKDALQGGWYVGLFVGDGDELKSAAPAPRPDMIIDGDRVTLYGHPAGRYKADASKSPKTIDFLYNDGDKEVGIYKLEGENLTICTAEPPDARPTDYTAPKGSRRKLYYYRRKP